MAKATRPKQNVKTGKRAGIKRPSTSKGTPAPKNQ